MGKFALLVGALVLAPLAVAGASDFDGSKALLCVPTDAVECSGPGVCERVTVEEINLPKWLNIDFGNKKISGVDSDGEQESTGIQNVRKGDGRTILQGAENGRGWSIVIDQSNGDMSAAIAGDAAGFVVFGVCRAR